MGLLPSSVVLMLHNITDTPTLGKKITLSEEKFYLLADSFKSWISIKDVLSPRSKKGIVMTFDDGYDDIYTVASPYLTQKKIPFTIFVTPDKLNQVGYLTTEQLKEISCNELCTVGGHCYHHQPLAKLSREEQEFELLKSKEEIEKIIGKPVEYMAYPYGQHNQDTDEILMTTDAYKAAFTTVFGFENFVNRKKRFQQPRVGIDNSVFDKRLAFLKKRYK